jgi:hypothetical protein
MYMANMAMPHARKQHHNQENTWKDDTGNED